MLYALLPPIWLRDADPDVRPLQLDCTLEEALEYNVCGFNLYAYPNAPSHERLASLPRDPQTGRLRFIKAKDIDQFDWVFVDLDMKHGAYADKDAFLVKLLSDKLIPNRIVDSGNGIHAYWRVSDLDAKSFLRLQRRLARYFNTDHTVAMLKQLMRVSGSVNMKDPENPKPCTLIYEDLGTVYNAETLDKWLPVITQEDEEFAKRHYESAYASSKDRAKIVAELPPRFLTLSREDAEIKHLYFGTHKDRSNADFRLGLQLFNHGFTRDEAMSVLSRTSKASERSAEHSIGYAEGIVTKVWDAAETEVKAEQEKIKKGKYPFRSVADVNGQGAVLGTRIYCNSMLDATEGGFRRTQVLGLVGGSGNGKSTVGKNMFRWFTEENVNADYIHLYVTLEQPDREIVAGWNKMAVQLKIDRPEIDWDRIVYVLGNYDEDGTFRELGLNDIREYTLALQQDTGKKVGCIVIDHIGCLRQDRGSKQGEMDGLIGVCKGLKSLAVATDTFLIIQSQTSRAKNSGGDVELDMDSAFGTSNFEFFCDYVMTTWQPLKRVYSEMNPESMLCVLAYKMAKIRNKDVLKDRIKADTVYGMTFDPSTELLRKMTSDEEKRYNDWWNPKATKARNKDRKKEPSTMTSISWEATKREKPSQGDVKT